MTAKDFIEALLYVFATILIFGGAMVLYMKNKLYEKRIIEYLTDDTDYADYADYTDPADYYLARNNIRETTMPPPPAPKVVVNPPPFKNVNDHNQMFALMDEEPGDADLVMDWMKRVQENNQARSNKIKKQRKN